MSHINILCLPYSFSSKETHLELSWSQVSSTDAKDQCIAYNSKNTEKNLYPTAKADFFGGESDQKNPANPFLVSWETEKGFG